MARSKLRTVVVVGAVAASVLTLQSCGSSHPSHRTHAKVHHTHGVQVTSGSAHLLPPGALPDSRLLLSEAGSRYWLNQAEQTLAVAHAHPSKLATLASFLSATRSTLAVQTIPLTTSGPDVHTYASYGQTSQRVTFRLLTTTRIHLTEGRSLVNLRPGTPLFIGGRRSSAPGGLTVQLVTDLGDLGRAAPHANSLASVQHVSHPSTSSASAPAGLRMEPVADVTASPDTPPADGVLLKNTVGWPGIDWTGGIHLGDEGGCPYLGVGLEAKVGVGAEWHWPFLFQLDQSHSLSVKGLDLPEAPFSFGVSDPGGDQAYYFSAGAAVGLSMEVACHFAFFGGDWTLADIGAKALLTNATVSHAPLSGEQDLSVPATDCLAFGAAPLKNLPSWIPFASQLSGIAELAISGCADIKISGGTFRGLVHGTGSSSGATPQGVALVSSKSAALQSALTGGRSVTIDQVNYQPLLHIGVGVNASLGADAGKVLSLGSKLQEALKTKPGSGSKPAATSTGKQGGCPESSGFSLSPQVLSCEINSVHAAATLGFDWPHPLPMVSPTILGEPVMLPLTPSAPSSNVSVMCWGGSSFTPSPAQNPQNCTIQGEPEITANQLILSNMKWSGWGGATASGTGTSLPTHPGQCKTQSCRNGMPITVSLNNPVPGCQGKTFYTKLHAQVQGFTGNPYDLTLSGACNPIPLAPPTNTTTTTTGSAQASQCPAPASGQGPRNDPGLPIGNVTATNMSCGDVQKAIRNGSFAFVGGCFGQPGNGPCHARFDTPGFRCSSTKNGVQCTAGSKRFTFAAGE